MNYEPVAAVAAGTAHTIFDYYGGNIIWIQHANNFVSIYAHLNSFAVGDSASVAQGQTIGTSGNTGAATSGPHLHFSIRNSATSFTTGNAQVPEPLFGSTPGGNSGFDQYGVCPVPGFAGPPSPTVRNDAPWYTAQSPVDPSYLAASHAGVYDSAGITSAGYGPWYERDFNVAGAANFAQLNYTSVTGCTPVTGDWMSLGRKLPGLYCGGTWYLSNASSPPGLYTPAFGFGWNGLIPITGDWCGFGYDGIGVYDPQTGNWYLRCYDGPGDVSVPVFSFGGPWAAPVSGDWTRRGSSGIGVFDRSNGPDTATWYLMNCSCGSPTPDFRFPYGWYGALPVTGDWTGAGPTTIGVWDPGARNWYLRNSVSGGDANTTFQFPPAVGSWTPLTGKWHNP